MVVDDEPNIVSALREYLAGHDIVSTTRGEEAVALLAATPFDAAFCDLLMPNVTGMDVYEQVRANTPGAERSIVFMTGGAYTPRARQFLGAVPNPLLTKPFGAAEVVKALDAARREYLRAVVEYNQAQFRLHRALGWPVDDSAALADAEPSR